MKKIIPTLLLTIILLTNCNNFDSTDSSESNITERSPEELKMDLKTQEQSAPTEYLTADGTYHENFWGDKLKISCTITNKATLATFKDVVVQVTYYSKTKTELGTNEYTIYEMFPPNSSNIIEMKIDNYKDVNSIGLGVINAISAN